MQRIELQQTAWQNFDPASSQIQSPSFSGQGIVGAVDLVLADPWYQEQHQPKPSEYNQVRGLFDELTHAGSVFIVFGKAALLYKCWAPIFENNRGGSKIEYSILPYLLHVIRSALRDKFTHNFTTWHSMAEVLLLS